MSHIFLVYSASGAGAGKTTFATALAEALGAPRRSFADPLKALARTLGWNGEKDEKGRRLLQTLGTDVCRNCIDTDYWVKKAEEAVNASPFCELTIFDDARFENEYTYWLRKGYIVTVFIIRRPGGVLFSHESEGWTPPVEESIVIENLGTREELEAIARSWAREFW